MDGLTRGYIASMPTNLKNPDKKLVDSSIHSNALGNDELLYHNAFNHSLQANIIFTAGTGKILVANRAACKLFGYSKIELSEKRVGGFYDVVESRFRKILMQQKADGEKMSLTTAIKKTGKIFPCEISSAAFTGSDGIKKLIATITDRSRTIQNQKNIDTANEKIVSDNISIAKSLQKTIDVEKEQIVKDNIALAKVKQRSIDTRNEKLVSDNIFLAKSLQKTIDVKKEQIVKDNIILAKVKQRNIDAKNEKLVLDNISLAKSLQKAIDVKKEQIVKDNITLAKVKQRAIDSTNKKLVCDNILSAKSYQRQMDAQKEKIVAADILVALAKSDARQVENDEWVKYLAERRSRERMEIGLELQDNINQLLCASRLYIDMAKDDDKNNAMFLARSSEYTLTAIKEIKKLTQSLAIDAINTLGLCKYIHNLSRETMLTSPIKISCEVKDIIEKEMSEYLKLNIYRIVQEQLDIILKSALTTIISINLFSDKKSIVLTILDNSIDFLSRKTENEVAMEHIKARALNYDGIAVFDFHPSKGRKLSVQFPISAKKS